MKTSEILQLDCRIKENEDVIQRVLRKIKPLASCPEGRVPIDKLERCMQVLSRKHDFVVTLSADTESNRLFVVWRCTIVRYGQSVVSGSNVFGCSVYEAIAKAVISMYSYSRRASN